MSRSSGPPLRVGFIVVLVGWAGVAAAQAPPPSPNTERARQAFLEGQTAYEAGDYEEAIRLWEQAYEIDPRPALHYNLAQAHGRLGHTVEEVQALERFVQAADPSDPLAADAAGRLARARERVARTAVRIINAPPGALIVVDGENHGQTPRTEPIRVSPGSHRVELTLNNRAVFRATVVARAAETVDVDASTSETAPQEEAGGIPTVPLVLWIAGGAVVVAGAVIGAVALAQSSDAVRDTSDADTAKALALVSDISIGVGLAAAATGLVLFLLGGSDDESEADPAVQASALVGPGFAGLGLEGRL